MLANRLEDTTLHSTELSDIFHTVLRENPSIKQAALADIVAFKERVRGRSRPPLNGGLNAVLSRALIRLKYASGADPEADPLTEDVFHELLQLPVHALCQTIPAQPARGWSLPVLICFLPQSHMTEDAWGCPCSLT